MEKYKEKYLTEIANIPVTITKKRVKTLRLYVYPDGRVRVCAPLFFTEERIISFLKEKAEWIEKKRSEFSDRVEKACGRSPLRSGDKLYFLGKEYTLKIREGTRSMLEIFGGEAVLNLKKEAFSKDDEEEKERVINAFYKKELEKIAGKFLKECEGLTGLNSSAFCIRNMRTRWGSCNFNTRKITFNLQLIKVPPRLIEYVALHEVLHIKIPNHGESFKTLLSFYMSDWRKRRKELSECGRTYAFL